MSLLARWLISVTAVATCLGCTGESGPRGNPGPEGAPGATGPQGLMGAMGPIGPKGQDGLDGQEGGTPFLLTNPFSGFIQYGDGDATLPLGETRVVAPADGHFLTRAYFSGTVAKRDGAARCRVQVRLHKATEVDPLALEDIGIMGAPLAGKIETSVSATLVTKINVTAGEAVDLRLEAQRRDDECANGAGAEQVAQIIGQLEVSFFHVPIVQQ